METVQTEIDPRTARRAAYVDSLREIVDWFAEHPEVPEPFHLLGSKLYIYVGRGHGDPKAVLATIARAMGRAEKVVDGDRFELHRSFGVITLVASATRGDVCERVVIGTHEVTHEVPDPEVVASAPKVTVTEMVEDVKWVCPPLLAEASS